MMTDVPSQVGEEVCALTSQQAAEPLYATAPAEVKIWLALEYAPQYGRDALDESQLPQDVKEFLKSLLASHPEVRLQLIKKVGTAGQEYSARSIFIARSDLEQSQLWRIPISDYQDLMNLDLEGIIHRGGASDDHLWDSQLFLICTNGKRDRCCSKWGIPFFQEFHRRVPDQVWQTSHTGGHRFAPNMIVLPAGVIYGRLQVGQIEPFLMQNSESNIVALDRYRGRACLSRPAQAAEYFIRRELNLVELERLSLVSERENAIGREVTFRDNQRDVRIRVELHEENNAYLVRTSCADVDRESISKLRLVSITTLQ